MNYLMFYLFDLNNGNMHLVLEGKQDFHKGFKCRYVKPENYIFHTLNQRGKSEYTYKIIFPDGSFEITKELLTFGEKHNINHKGFYDILNGKQFTHHGFRIERI
jgi:hypothetical protein